MYKCNVMCLFSVVIIYCLFYLVDSFNIETINYARHNGSYNSMFGFSIATHREQGQSWVLVGAPKEQDSYSGITKGGVVYKCNIHYDDSCEQIQFHQNTSEQVRTLDDKENQWFGATVSSAGPDGPVVACAPRYVWFTTSREERRDPVGTCYIAKNNFRSFSEYSPCRTSLFGYHRQGSCQAGFSAGISNDSRRLFIGAPGSWYWQGQSYSIDPSIKYPYTPGIFGEAFGFGTKGQIIQQNLDDRPAVVSTPESPATYDNSYMGYSMVVGDFNGAKIQGAAVGMPKGGKKLEGKVLLYTWDLTNYLNITGKQLGEYFGYSVAKSDIDGDQRDDLIIGAPLHAEKNSEMKYEVGRVYIAYQGLNGSFARVNFLDGYNSKSRFGLSVSGLGDLNLDGFGDFAVGAPYDGPNEQGAVYIFQGSANGVISQYSQVIYAEDIQRSFSTFHYVDTFGFSISGGLDLDGNDYPDMAVGAYLSDASYFFRARPVVKVEANLNFVANPKQIFLERPNCAKPGDPSKLVPCIDIELRMRYTGVGIPSTLEFQLSYTLDTQKHAYSRMYFEDYKTNKTVNTTIVLRRNDTSNFVTRRRVYLEDPLSDKLTELEIRLEYSLNQEKYYQTSRDPNSILQAVLDSTYPTVVNDSISIYKNCGDDNKCTPSLYLAVKQKFDRYVYQVGKPLQFDVKVINSEENSYGTKFFINLPQGVTFTVAYKVTDEETPISCKKLNETLYSCGLDDPLTKENPSHFIVEVEPLGKQKILKPTYDFYMNVTSANPGRIQDLVNQTRHISVDVWVNAILQIEKKSTPTTIFYNISHGKSKESLDNQMQPLVIHSYTLTNKGPADVEEVEMYIVWPEETLAGQDLLYLLEQPHTLGGVTCERVDVNALNLPIYHLKDVWEGIVLNKQDFLGNSTQGQFIENGTGRPGEVGDTKTKTITKVTFYDNNKKEVYHKTLIGEPEWNEYWGNISAIASDYTETLTIHTNQTTLVEKYVQGIKISDKIVARPDDPFNEYKIKSNSTTVVRYYGPAENLIFEETITAQPGSLEFKNQIKNTKDKFQGVTSVITTTTKHIRIETMTGKLVHEELLTLTGTEKRTDPVISRTSIVTNVTYYNQNHKLLYNEAFSVQPTSNTYWNEINKFISRFKEPITIHTSTAKVVTYFKNNVEVRREESPLYDVVEAPVTSHTEVTTLITIKNINGTTLYEDLIAGEDYSNHLNSIIQIYKEPVNVNIKTTYVITYTRQDNKVVRIGTYIKERTELILPTQLETKSTRIITVVTIYDVHKKILHQENITESADSKEYWEKLNKLVSQYHQPVTITKRPQTIITYYINGKEVRNELDTSVYVPGTSLSTQTDIKALIQIFNSTGDVVYVEHLNAPVSEGHVKALLSRYRELITMKIKTTNTIHYYDSAGLVVQTGILIAERTITHVPRNEETTKIITTVTTVTVLDVYNNVLYRENITDAPDSVAYWEKINKIITSYKEPVTVQKVTQTIITYYVEGVPIRSEPQGPPTSDTALSTHVDVASMVTVYDSRGGIIFEQPISGEVSPNQINEIVSRFRESITVNVKTTYIINYRSPDGGIIKTGTYVIQRTEKHDVKHNNETQTTTTITTVTFKDLSGNILLHENVTETPASNEYWEKLTQLVSSFKQQVVIEVKTQTIITYYIDGHVVGTKLVDGSGVKETDLTTQSTITTVITVTNPYGATLHTETHPRLVTNDDIQNILRRFSETIIVNIETTHRITYLNSQGNIVQIGTYIQKRTETHTRPANEISKVTTRTTIIFYDNHRNILHQETISEEPESPTYWKTINEIITRFRKTVTVRITVERTKTYYVNGQPIRVEPMPIENPITYTSRTNVTTYIEIHAADGRILYEQPINFEKGTANYNTIVGDLVRRFREYVTVKTKSTYLITYIGLDGRVSHTETIIKEDTETHNYHQQETEQVSTITAFTLYDSHNRMIHQESIREEPGSRIFWDQIKVFIEKFQIPASIKTNTTKIITYVVNGRTVRQEHRSDNKGDFATPILCETETLISYYDSQNKFLHTEHAAGDLNNQELQFRVSTFGKSYQIASVQLHKTVTFRGSSGQIIHTFTIPVNHQLRIPAGNHQIIDPGNHQQTSRTVTETTFVVYGADRERVLYTETITGEPGSDSYNNVVAKILRAYPAPFTIYTNSTKTTTYYSQEGVQLNKHYENEAQSTIQQEGGSIPSSARTTITFYGPNGQPLLTDTINGAPGADLQDQLRKIAGDYGGAVKSYGGFVNGGSIGGNVNFIDSPHPGGRPTLSPQQFNDFNSRNLGSIHNNSQHASEYEYEYSSEDVDDLHNEGLGSFARGNGFRTGGLDFGVGNGGNANHYVDTQARNNFDARRTYEQDHNYLSSRSNRRSTREIHSKKSKREDKTDADIKTLSSCTTSRCLLIKCVSGPIPIGHEVHIAIRARVFLQTLKNISVTQPVTIQSSLLARVSKFLQLSVPPVDRNLYSAKTSTLVMAPQLDVKPDVVPLWVVVLSAVAGTLILLLLIFLLYMCGFFNRNRPSDAPERQPLNRNGHFHHGDEAL